MSTETVERTNQGLQEGATDCLCCGAPWEMYPCPLHGRTVIDCSECCCALIECSACPAIVWYTARHLLEHGSCEHGGH